MKLPRRTRLDYSYHKVPMKSRQLLQDSILADVLKRRTKECKDCYEDSSHPQVLFTAGAMASGVNIMFCKKVIAHPSCRFCRKGMPCVIFSNKERCLYQKILFGNYPFFLFLWYCRADRKIQGRSRHDCTYAARTRAVFAIRSG